MPVGVGVHACDPRNIPLPRIMGLPAAAQALRRSAERQISHFGLLLQQFEKLGGALVLAQDDAPRYLEMLSKAGLLPPGQAQQSLEPVEERW